MKLASAFEEEENGVAPTDVDVDVGGEDEEDEDPDELYTDTGKETQSPVVKKEDDEVIDLDETVGSSEDKPVDFQCGIATSYLIVDDKQAASRKKNSQNLN